MESTNNTHLSLKVLVLGTSNSMIKNGWVTGFQESLPGVEITNLSVGNSPGIQFGCTLDMKFDDFDLVFFDSVVNDEYLMPGIGGTNFLHRVVYEIISTIASQTAVVVLGFSHAKYLDNHSEVYRRRQELAAICGVQFIGIHELVEMYGEKILQGRSALLYEGDGTHPNLKISHLLGFQIGKLIVSARGILGSISKPLDFSGQFSVEQAKDLVPQDKLITKKNSAMSVTFCQLERNVTLEFRSAGLCLGFYVDFLTSSALVALDGAMGRRIKEFQPAGGTPTYDFLLRFVSVKNGFPLQRLKILDVDEIPSDRGTIEIAWPRATFKVFPRDNMELAFSSALFWSGNPDDPLPSAPTDFENTLVLHRLLAAAIEDRLSLHEVPI